MDRGAPSSRKCTSPTCPPNSDGGPTRRSAFGGTPKHRLCRHADRSPRAEKGADSHDYYYVGVAPMGRGNTTVETERHLRGRQRGSYGLRFPDRPGHCPSGTSSRVTGRGSSGGSSSARRCSHVRVASSIDGRVVSARHSAVGAATGREDPAAAGRRAEQKQRCAPRAHTDFNVALARCRRARPGSCRS
jgi:hypothetical protein